MNERSETMESAEVRAPIHTLLNKIEIKAREEIYPDSQISVLQSESESGTFGDNATLVVASHFFKSLFSPTILVLPGAFRSGGLIFSVFGYVSLVVLIGYNISRLIISAEYLSHREKLDIRTYDQVAFVSFETCSVRTRSYAKTIRTIVNLMFIITNLDALTIFMIFIARNSQIILLFYYPDKDLNIRHFIFFQVSFIMMVNTIRQLKYLTPFSIVAAIVLFVSTVMCFQSYLIVEYPSPWERKQCGDYSIIRFIAIVLFSQSGISIALTLKSSMKKPHQFLSVPGVFCVTIILATIMYVPFGFMGYLKYGEGTMPSILLNLPNDTEKSIVVKSLTIIAVFMNVPIVFYVAFNVLWNNFLRSHVREINHLSAEYLTRSVLVIVPFLLAMALPTLGPMIVLKGALFHSQLEVVYPPMIEFAAFYPEKGHGKGYCRLIKAVIISTCGILFCISGTILGIWDIIKMKEELIQ